MFLVFQTNLKYVLVFSEWIKLNILGQQCELRELNVEDRKRIEEIKKELLLKKHIQVTSQKDLMVITGDKISYTNHCKIKHDIFYEFMFVFVKV